MFPGQPVADGERILNLIELQNRLDASFLAGNHSFSIIPIKILI